MIMKIAEKNLKFINWQDFRLSYEVYNETEAQSQLALLLIHPIGVGLSRCFWHPFIQNYAVKSPNITIYNPDLLGCGATDLPRLAYYPIDWALQLQYLLETAIKKPTIIITQGASLPIALKMLDKSSENKLIKGFIFASPPAWQLITKKSNPLLLKLVWNLLFDSPVGNLFYRYARRREFIKSFSTRQLFATAEAVSDRWLDTLEKGAADPQTRYAVFSFLAGFWLEDYTETIANISQPTAIVFGEQTSSISKTGANETRQERLESYLKYLANGEGKIIPGRNVLPYESPAEFAVVVKDFVAKIIATNS